MHSLNSLSDRELVNCLRTLVDKEQNLTLKIVPHLVEVIRRGLHLGKGYGSLYEYCKGELGYTDASAWRRARAAQAIVRCPEALDRLKRGDVNLCTLGQVSKFVTPAILEKICGKSKAEVELIAASYDAKGAAPDRTRPVMVPKTASPKTASPGTDRLPSEVNVTDTKTDCSLRGEVDEPSPKQDRSLRRGVERAPLEFEQKWKIETTVSNQVKAKLDQCKSLLSRKYPQGVDYEILLGELAELFLERKDPERKRRKHGRQTTKLKRVPKVPESRHIPAGEKQKVWTRDKGRCTYVGASGRRCNSTYNLQFDHYPIPYARGGPNKASNLRLLCATHNRFTAEKRNKPERYPP